MSHKKQQNKQSKHERGNVNTIVECLILAIRDNYITEKQFDFIYKKVKTKLHK